MSTAKEQRKKLLAVLISGEILAANAARDKKNSLTTSQSGGES
jgi:hypothetical protein